MSANQATTQTFLLLIYRSYIFIENCKDIKHSATNCFLSCFHWDGNLRRNVSFART